MNDVDDVRCSISELVNRYGIEKVKSALNDVIPDHEHMGQKEFRCLCGSFTEIKDAANGSLYLLFCTRCKEDLFAYNGTARTKRQSRDGRTRHGSIYDITKVTIRSYDANGAERVIALPVYASPLYYSKDQKDYFNNNIELKSKDKFTLIVMLRKGRFSNHTVGTTNSFDMASSDLHFEWAGAIRKAINENSTGSN